MLNEKVAGILYEVADLLELKDEKFKPQAYRKAAHNIESMKEDIVDVYRRGHLKDVPGVGEAIEAKVREIIETGELRYLKELHDEFPAGLLQIMDIPEIGPKTTMRLYKELRVTNVQDLKLAAEQHRIRRLKGFGDKTEENILKGIEYMERNRGRMLLGYAFPVAMGIVSYLQQKGGLAMVSVAGSLRRMKETIGDIDILVGTAQPERASDVFVSYPEVEDVLAKGPTKSAVRLSNGIQVDLRVVSESSYGAALLYFTGSREHNIKLRSLAIDKGYKLNEYGLFNKDTGVPIASANEEDIYRRLGLDMMPPEMREDQGEIDISAGHALPELVALRDIKGDLHMHTEASDGSMSMEEMALAGKARGYEYVGITDHSQSLRIANGLDAERLRKNIAMARDLSSMMGAFQVLIGAEVEIDERGKLDYPDDLLMELDYVIGAVHTRFKMTEAEMTDRLLTALSNDHMTILAHPTGRAIGQREAYALDMERVMDEAKGKGVFLEVNSYPERLDLNDRHCRMAHDNGNRLVINTDSHHPSHLDNMTYGVAQARRGWVGPRQVLNTLPLKDLQRALGL
jgi:DNA polymerase (family 10)